MSRTPYNTPNLTHLVQKNLKRPKKYINNKKLSLKEAQKSFLALRINPRIDFKTYPGRK